MKFSDFIFENKGYTSNKPMGNASKKFEELVNRKLYEDEDLDTTKYGRDKKFQLRKMAVFARKKDFLLKEYKKLYEKYKEGLGYHYNEIMLALLFIKYIVNNQELFTEYEQTFIKGDEPTKILDETTTASASGQYSTPFAFSKKNLSGRSIYKGGTQVKKNIPSGMLMGEGDRCGCNSKLINKTEDEPNTAELDKEQENEKMFLYDMEENKQNKFSDLFENIIKEEKKTPSMLNYDKISNETKNLTKKDFKEHSNIKELSKISSEEFDNAIDYDYDKDSLKPEDIKKKNLTDEEKIQLEDDNVDYANRGMESIEYNIGDKDQHLEDNLGKVSGRDGKKELERVKKNKERNLRYKLGTNTRDVLSDKGLDKYYSATGSYMNEATKLRDMVEIYPSNSLLLKESNNNITKLYIEYAPENAIFEKLNENYDFYIDNKSRKIYHMLKENKSSENTLNNDMFNKLTNYDSKEYERTSSSLFRR